ncbi:hypothetical protein TomTYG45_04590 [Sphingobium sp. TomTYG45]
MVDAGQVDSSDRPRHRVKAGGQTAQAGNGKMSQKPNDSTAIARFFDKIGGFIHQGGLVVHYRLHGKPKRPIRTVER